MANSFNGTLSVDVSKNFDYRVFDSKNKATPAVLKVNRFQAKAAAISILKKGGTAVIEHRVNGQWKQDADGMTQLAADWKKVQEKTPAASGGKAPAAITTTTHMNNLNRLMQVMKAKYADKTAIDASLLNDFTIALALVIDSANVNLDTLTNYVEQLADPGVEEEDEAEVEEAVARA